MNFQSMIFQKSCPFCNADIHLFHSYIFSCQNNCYHLHARDNDPYVEFTVNDFVVLINNDSIHFIKNYNEHKTHNINPANLIHFSNNIKHLKDKLTSLLPLL